MLLQQSFFHCCQCDPDNWKAGKYKHRERKREKKAPTNNDYYKYATTTMNGEEKKLWDEVEVNKESNDERQN